MASDPYTVEQLIELLNLKARYDRLCATRWQDDQEKRLSLQQAEMLEAAATQLAQVEELQKELAIVKLAIPLEEDLYSRIDDTCKHLLQEQGFTLNGIGRLLIDCQQRMASDWSEIGNLRRELSSTRLAPQQEPAWQPIATAPTDETRVLLYNPDEGNFGWGIQSGAYYEQLGGWQYDGQRPMYSNAHQPTHWQPLPVGPPVASSRRETQEPS